MNAPEERRGGNRAEQFYNRFKHETAGIEDALAALSARPAEDAERAASLADCADRLRRVALEVQDASPSLPPHDRKTYADALAALGDRLLRARKAGGAAKPRFAFRKGTKIAGPAASPSAWGAGSCEAVTVEAGGSSGLGDGEGSSVVAAPLEERGLDGRGTGSQARSSGPLIARREGQIVVLPVAGEDVETTPHISGIEGCVVDVSRAYRERGLAFANLNVKDMRRSLLLGGAVKGAVHLGRLKHCVVLVRTHQFRMHDCLDTVVYLHCTSQPIIDGCEGILFAPLPDLGGAMAMETTRRNMWDQVQDFKWLKQSASPNWRILREEEKIGAATWGNIMRSEGEAEAEDVLKEVGLDSSTLRDGGT